MRDADKQGEKSGDSFHNIADSTFGEVSTMAFDRLESGSWTLSDQVLSERTVGTWLGPCYTKLSAWRTSIADSAKKKSIHLKPLVGGGIETSACFSFQLWMIKTWCPDENCRGCQWIGSLFPPDDTGIIMDLLDYNDCLEIEDVGRISWTSCWTARRPG